MVHLGNPGLGRSGPQGLKLAVGERVVTDSPVCSYNEWDPLEEAVVGRLEGARIPSRHLTVTFNIPQRLMKIYKLIAGLPYPSFVVRPAQRELDEFIHMRHPGRAAARRAPVVLLSADFSGEPLQTSPLGRIPGYKP